MELDQALEHALDGDAVLFAGAGYSRGAVNLRDAPLKTGGELAKHFSELVGLPQETALDEAAEEYAEELGPDSLISELQHEFMVRGVAQHHLFLANIPWRSIYTTNYDNVLETASKGIGKRLSPVTTTDDIRDMPTDHVVVHLNGFVDRLNRETLSADFRLTDTSYTATSLADSPWLVLFRQDLRFARAVFFVGYSLADLDIRRFLFESTDLHDKTFFVLGDSANRVTSRRASRFGTVLQHDAKDLARLLRTKQFSYSPIDRSKHIGDAIHLFEPPSEPPPFSDQTIFDLFLYGNVSSGNVWSALHGGERYFLDRPVTDGILEHLTQPNAAFVIHSELGNGKTLLIEGLKCHATARGFDVYTVAEWTTNLFQELDVVCQASTKTLLIIDDYSKWRDVFEYIGMRRNPQVSLLLASRTSIHDVLIGNLTEALGNHNIPELMIDRTTSSDLEWIVECFDEYGLWGPRASWSHWSKISHLQNRCRSQFNQILLDILNSPQILSRFRKIMDAIKQQEDYYEVIIGILVLTVLQYRPSVDNLVDIWGMRVLETQFRRNDAVRQLLDFNQGEVSLHSAVAARHLLQQVVDANVIVEVLTRIAKVADWASAASLHYRDLLRDIMRFGSLQTLLPERNRRRAVIRYYESIKNLYAARNQPHFWLQYAIATLVTGDLVRAKTYFDTAYAFANARDRYDTYMIDNHYARYLLVAARQSDDVDSAMKMFEEAQGLLEPQLPRERLHYSYRVARFYRGFFDTWQSKMSPGEKAKVGQAARYVAEKIARLPELRRKHRYIAECAEAMEHLIQRTAPDALA